MDASHQHNGSHPAGVNPWRAGCGENRTSGSEGRAGETDPRKLGNRAPTRPLLPLVFSGVERPVGPDPVDRDERAVQDQVSPVLAGFAQGLVELGRAGRQQRHCLVHIPPRVRGRYPKPAPSSANVSPLHRWTSTSSACPQASALVLRRRSPCDDAAPLRWRSSGLSVTTTAQHERKAHEAPGADGQDCGDRPS